MRLLVLSYERLISNGTAGTAVMCGLVDSALKKGWEVTYVALTRSETPEAWQTPYDFAENAPQLRQEEVVYTKRQAPGALTRFIGSFRHASVNEISPTSAGLAALQESYDAVIAFDSLAITLADAVVASNKILIIGDPAGRRLWHSTSWNRPLTKCKAALLDIGEYLFYRTLPKRATIAMFGSGHAARWSALLRRTVVDLRPFLAAPKVEIAQGAQRTPVIYFGGTLAGTASRQSFDMIFNGLVPALRQKFGAFGFVLRIVGDCPPAFVERAAALAEIELTGRVASFEAELSKGDVFILPMNYPVGVRTRVCSALAAGNICLVHPAILYNMPELRTCPAVTTVRTPREYAQAIATLPTGQELLRLRHKAIDFFNQHYIAAIASEQLFRCIK